jgi:hypothetical protein
MNLSKLNAILGDLNNIDPKLVEFIKKEEINTPISEEDEGIQGEENTSSKVYKVKGENVFIKVLYYTDSYGYGEYARGIQFVQPIKKEVIDYELVK